MMETNLPYGWLEIELSEITNYKKGKKPKKMQSIFFENALVYLDIKAIEKGNDEIFVDRKSSNFTDENDLIIVWDGARAGWVAKSRKGAIGSTIMALTPKIDNDFLFRFLQTQFNYIQSNHRGTGIPHVDPDIFWNIRIPIPPIAEQRRIIVKLNSVLQIIENYKKRIDGIPKLLKRFRQSVLIAAFKGKLTQEWRTRNAKIISPEKALLEKIKSNKKLSKEYKIERFEASNEFSWDDLPELANNWIWASASEIVEDDSDIVYGIVQPGPKLNVGVPYIRGTAIQNGKILIEQLLKTSPEIAKRYEKASLKEGDVLLGIIRATKVAIVPKQLNGANITQGTARFRPSKLITTNYLALWLQSHFAQQWLHNQYRGIDMPGLNLRDVRKLPQSILAKAFRGELVSQNPDDEPASVLLEKIRQEKLQENKKVRKLKAILK